MEHMFHRSSRYLTNYFTIKCKPFMHMACASHNKMFYCRQRRGSQRGDIVREAVTMNFYNVNRNFGLHTPLHPHDTQHVSSTHHFSGCIAVFQQHQTLNRYISTAEFNKRATFLAADLTGEPVHLITIGSVRSTVTITALSLLGFSQA